MQSFKMGAKCKKSVAHKIPMLNVDGWTDGRTDVRTDERTNGRKLARLCLPAKAGATINRLLDALCPLRVERL